MSRKRQRVDEDAKSTWGSVPAKHPKLARGDHPRGTYIQQSETFKKTPSGHAVEVDHMSPDSLHQPIGQKRSGGEGAQLSKRLPAAAMNKLQHRRKLTTASGNEVEHHRRYLLAAHVGMVPFTGPMTSTQDHYAAALEVEFRSSATPATLFGETTLHDPRVFHRPSHVGDVPMADALWGMDRQEDLVHRVQATGNIEPSHVAHLKDVQTEQRAAVAQMYKDRGKS